MRKTFLLIVSLIMTALLFNACKSSSNSPAPATGPGNSYFPNGDGTSYKYSVTKTDSAQNQSSGTRSSTYNGTTTLNGVVYQNEIDTISFGGIALVSNSLFVKSNSGVSFAIDTSGLSESIPAAYLQYIKMSTSLNVFQFPMIANSPWNVFNMTLNISGLSDTLVNVTGVYVGMEQVPVNLTSGAKTFNAAKILYTFTLSIPNAASPLSPPTVTKYYANAWMADNVGMIQMQGNGAIMDAFTGGGIHFADTTSSVTQSLISYSIK